MPLARIYLLEGRYNEARMGKVSNAVQAALMNTLRVPPEGFYHLIFETDRRGKRRVLEIATSLKRVEGETLPIPRVLACAPSGVAGKNA
jgi:hypothetical protein